MLPKQAASHLISLRNELRAQLSHALVEYDRLATTIGTYNHQVEFGVGQLQDRIQALDLAIEALAGNSL